MADNRREKSVTEMTLPELLSVITKRVLTTLEQGDTAAKQNEINGCRNDLRLWYENQPVAKRRDIAKDSRRIMQNYRNIGEQFNSDLVSLTAQDVA